jgi:hypothetical protein
VQQSGKAVTEEDVAKCTGSLEATDIQIFTIQCYIAAALLHV